MVGQVLQILRKKHVKGITLVELMVVLVILAIIAAIALPYFMTRRKELYNASSEATAKDAYIVAQLYFSDYPDGSLPSIEILTDMGLKQKKSVNVTVTGTQSDLVITAYHTSGDKTYTIDHEGTIQEF
jgi:type IV pilus assembly protein PilA